MSETRKLAAILAADVVGYSRLMGEDEAGTARAVRERREAAAPIVREFGGRLVKTMGDGVLIEFPSVVAAVECALLIQKMMAECNADVPEAKRILYRIGVNLGDVLIDGDDILGDGVNIAARLEGVCAPGGVLISGEAYDHVRGRIEARFIDLGEKQLKNIARPVRVYSIGVSAPAQPTTAAPPKSAAPNRRATAALSAGLGVLAVAVGAWYWLAANRPAAVPANAPAPVASNAAAPAEAKHFSIVVLPFANLSGDPAQDYFADGITENLTTELSRIRDSFVVARNTAFTYKGKSIDAKEIGRELGVRYVLEGSVQRDGSRVRINAQFVDSESGAHLWADRFDEDVADLFKLQDEVVARLAATLGLALRNAEAARGSRSKDPDAVDLTMRGWALARPSQQTKEKNAAARTLFEQALNIDPDNADALAGVAYTYANEYVGWKIPGTDYDAKVLPPADRAIAIAPDAPWAYYAKCVYLYYSHRAAEAIDAADAGLAVNPNAPLWGVRGNAELFDGRFEQAKSDILRSIKLNPRDPLVYFSHKYLGDAELGLGHFDAAIDDYHRAINLGMSGMWPYTGLTAAYALSGKPDETKSALADLLRLNPKATIKSLSPIAPPVPNLFDGLRKAGLPEDAPAEAKHLSIVVLPFANLSGDPSQDYFADGITENLTTELSRIRNSFVIARNTAFTYKGKSIDAKEIGKELGVRYVLEGSVQREQNRVRINVQLVDAESGAHLWADRFEEDVADLFKLQDQVVARLSNSLGNELFKAEEARSARSKNPDAIDLTMRGEALMREPWGERTKDKNNAARALFEQALTIDPNEAEALAGEADTYITENALGWSGENSDFLSGMRANETKIIDLVDRAIALAPDSVEPYAVKAWYLHVAHRWDEAIRAADAGLAINPNSAALFDERAWNENELGRFEQAKSDIQQAMRLSPRDPEMGTRHLNLGDAELGLGHFDAAIDEFHKADNTGTCSECASLSLAAAFALAGRMDEAKAALAEAVRVSKHNAGWLLKSVPSVLVDGLRKAGLPEE
jgi:TolB-like protein/Tfp pilus assembly protein PilF